MVRKVREVREVGEVGEVTPITYRTTWQAAAMHPGIGSGLILSVGNLTCVYLIIMSSNVGPGEQYSTTTSPMKGNIKPNKYSLKP